MPRKDLTMARKARPLAPAGVGSSASKPLECFITDVQGRTLYILKDSGLKVLRAAGAVMNMRITGPYRQVMLSKEAFSDQLRQISRVRKDAIAERRAILRARRQH